jgi:NAD(P)-dependent dehydrogenase (short-subunit alcohol dehydrogenase family)
MPASYPSRRFAFLGTTLTLIAFHGTAPTALAAQDAAGGDRTERVALITGSTGGLGREVARALAADGAHVIIHGRNEERGNALVAEIEAAGSGSARFYRADLASFDEVRAFARRIRRDYQRLDVLVNNAGIWLDSPERQLSVDGHEMHFQVNYLSGFLLTRELLSMIVGSAPSRIVNVSSVAQRPIDFDDVMMEEGYSDGRAYAQSKLAQVMFTFDLALELEGRDVIVVAVHPASMMDTDMVLERGARARSSVQEGKEAVMHVITSAEVRSGQYFRGLEPARANPQAYDEAARAWLKRLSQELTGIS